MDKTTKREFRYFLLTDYEREEEYLRRRHQEGWRLTRIGLPGAYSFERCEPEDVVYRLDFNPQAKQEREDYIQLFRDYGWEYLQDLNEYSYFRKPAEAASAADNEIFSDDESRLEMLKRIFRCRMLPILAIFVSVMAINMTTLHRIEAGGALAHAVTFLWGLCFGLYLVIIGRCAWGFWRLGKKYKKLKN